MSNTRQFILSALLVVGLWLLDMAYHPSPGFSVFLLTMVSGIFVWLTLKWAKAAKIRAELIRFRRRGERFLTMSEVVPPPLQEIKDWVGGIQAYVTRRLGQSAADDFVSNYGVSLKSSTELRSDIHRQAFQVVMLRLDKLQVIIDKLA